MKKEKEEREMEMEYSNNNNQSSSILSRLVDSFKTVNLVPKINGDNDNNNKLEYLFEDDHTQIGPSWGARICYGSGWSYLTGLGIGGIWGLLEGIANPQGRTAWPLRLNCIINGCTSRGPFLGNTAGIIALWYNLIHGAMIKIKKDQTYTMTTSIMSAALTGFFFKSFSSSIKKATISGITLATLMTLYNLLDNHNHSNKDSK